MARGGRRQGSARAGAKAPAASPSRDKNRGRRPPGEPTERDIARSIQTSACRVRVVLQLEGVKTDEAPFSGVVSGFVGAVGGAPSAAVTVDSAVGVELLECGLNCWENLVDLQRLVAGTRRPQERGEYGVDQEVLLIGRTVARHDAKTDEWRLMLSFVRTSEDALWAFATSLMLRLRSVGVFSRVLLSSQVMGVPLAASVVEWDQQVGELAQFKWEGCFSWSRIAVSSASVGHSDELQRVWLPPTDSSVALPSALPNLRHSALLDIVDDMLKSNTGERKPIAIILRGIPGSGKSTLRREIATICRHRGVMFSVCSADFFFETPRGYVFDVRKLGPAHDRCKTDFTKAIQSAGSRRRGDKGKGKQRRPSQHIVVVDNTSTQRWEYEIYQKIAQDHGSHSYILEMTCPDALTAFRMGQRNSHGVPPGKVVSMFLRWEQDTRAQCFTPNFEHTQLTANPLSDSHVEDVTYVGLFLDEASREALLTKIPVAHQNVLADHVTLFYRPNKQYMRDVELGETLTVKAVEIVQDERGQTLQVELDERLPLQTRNKVSHITISTIDGVSAAYSNELLENRAATRIPVDPPVEIKVRVGAALLVNRQRTITTTSPFSVGAQDCAVERTLELETGTASRSLPTNTFVLYVEETDLVEAAEVGQERDSQAKAKLLLQIQLQHHMGPAYSTRRLLCVQRSDGCSSLSRTEMLSGVHHRFLLPPLRQIEFDDLLVIPEKQTYQAFHDAVIQRLGDAGGVKPVHLSILTTSSAPLQWPLNDVEKVQGATLSVTRIGCEGAALTTTAALAPQCSTIESILDLLGINVQEQTRSAVRQGICAVDDAWASVLEMGPATTSSSVRRVDTTLLGLDSDVVELCLLLPPSTKASALVTLQRKLVETMQFQGNIWDVVESHRHGEFYFRMRSLSSYTPVFCVKMASESIAASSAENGVIMMQLGFCEVQQRHAREQCEVEVYTVLTALLRAILRERCSIMASESRLSSWVNLLSERLTWLYLQQVASPEIAGVRPSADDVASGRIMFTLYDMLVFLSKWEEGEWASALTTPLRGILGDRAKQLEWQRLMAEVTRDCADVLAAFKCCSNKPLDVSSSIAADHLAVLVGLLCKEDQQSRPGGDGEEDKAPPGPVHAYVELPKSSKPSTLRRHVLCDALKSSTVAVAVAWQGEPRSASEACFFRCAPSQLTRRVNMAASSMEDLRRVTKRFGADLDSRRSEDGGCNIFHAGDLELKLAANDVEVVMD